VSNAVHLRFDVRRSSLPEWVKDRLLNLGDSRVTRSGDVLIKAQNHRSLEMNREEALARLQALVASAAHVPRRAGRRGRHGPRSGNDLDSKVRRGKIKRCARRCSSEGP